MDDHSEATETSSAALVGWGMTLLAVGAAITTGGLRRESGDGIPGLAVAGVLLLLFGWGLLTGGLVTMAQRVDRVSRRHAPALAAPEAPAPVATAPEAPAPGATASQ